MKGKGGSGKGREHLPYRVDFQVAPAFAKKVDEGELRRIVAEVLRREGVEAGTELAIVLTDDKGIRDLNRDFRGVDEPTDVLAFGTVDEFGFVAPEEAMPYLGDIVISYPRAVAQAKEAGHPVGKELALLVIHGVLHLLGYEDETEEGRARMWARQEELLKEVAS